MNVKDRLTSFLEKHVQEMMIVGAVEAAREEVAQLVKENDLILQVAFTMLGLCFEDAGILPADAAPAKLLDDLSAIIAERQKTVKVRDGRAFRNEEN